MTFNNNSLYKAMFSATVTVNWLNEVGSSQCYPQLATVALGSH